MPLHTSNDRIAQALAAVDVTAAPFDILAAQTGWADLKAARGQSVDFARLAPAHLMARHCPPVVVPIDTAASIQARALSRTRAYIQSLPGLGGGAA